MRTLILPGFSAHNKQWANEARDKLGADVHGWRHWETGNKNDFLVAEEVETISREIKSQVNVIAKSVGTLVCMLLLAGAKEKIKRIILCGVPMADLSPEDKSRYEVLSHMDGNHVICFQNDNDPHGKHTEVLGFINGFNSDISVIEKSREDHEYPYFSEFEDFIKRQ